MPVARFVALSATMTVSILMGQAVQLADKCVTVLTEVLFEHEQYFAVMDIIREIFYGAFSGSTAQP
jgi:hypothetical protein